MFRLLKIGAMLFFLTACSEKITTAIVQTEKESVTYTLEIADTPETMAKGLMYRKEMALDHGMLFVFEKKHPQPVMMWMKNTLISLDMLFLDEQKTIIGIAENTIPLSLKTISPTKKQTKFVIELNAGEVKKHHIKIGDKVLYVLSN